MRTDISSEQLEFIVYSTLIKVLLYNLGSDKLRTTPTKFRISGQLKCL